MLALLLILLLGVDSGLASENVEQLASRAAAAMQNNRFEEAEKAYRAILDLAPHITEVRSNLGLALYFEEKLPAAEQEFRAVLKTSPRLFVPNFFLGKILFWKNHYPEAKLLFKTAANLKPDDVEARRWLANTYVGLEEFDKGLEEYRQILKWNPENADALHAVGKIYTELMQRSVKQVRASRDDFYRTLMQVELAKLGSEWNSAARSQIAQLIQSNPTYAGLRLELGYLELAEGNIPEAGRLLRDELSVDAFSFQAHLGLAIVSLLSEGYEEFASELELAVSIRPESFCPVPQMTSKIPPATLEKALKKVRHALAEKFLREQLGEKTSFCKDLVSYRQNLKKREGPATSAKELVERKRYEAALSRLGIAASGQQPARFDRQLLRVRAHFESGNYSAAAKAGQILVGLKPDSDVGSYWLSKCYYKLAEQSLNELGKVAPNSYRVYQLKGETQFARQDMQQAILAFEEALKLEPRDAELLFQLGRSHYYLGNFSSALEVLSKSLELDPFNAEACYIIGEAWVYNQEGEKAVPYLKKALELNPSMLKAHAELGKAYLQTDNAERAVKELETASSTDKVGDLHYLLFRAYSKLNQKENAEKALKISTKLRQEKAGMERRTLEKEPNTN